MPEPAGHQAPPGSLSAPPHPLLSELLYQPQLQADRAHLLPHLLRVDAAHVVMLAERRLLPDDVAGVVLHHNRELVARVAAGEDVLGQPDGHRGIYLLYERQYIQALGPEAGGAAHLARSRNDLNATLARMRLRQELSEVLGRCGELLRVAAGQAERHAGTVMAGFTHQQPAQPTTLGHYLAAILAELLRSSQWLDGCLDALDGCPMGAGAGFGTSFAIDPGRVADLLGFGGPVRNSVDAVASRDYAVRTLCGAAMLGVTLTRLATDLQSWSSAAYGFLGWPDELVAASSIMPHKRNASVLESLRGQAVHPVPALLAALVGLKNVPFANSVEAGEATAHLWPALDALRTAIRVANLLLERLQVQPDALRDFLARSRATLSALADLLAGEHGLAFRTAHQAVAALARAGVPIAPAEVAARLQGAVRELTGRALTLDPAMVAAALDPAAAVAAAAHGGGPAPGGVRQQLADMVAEIDRLQARQGRRRTRWAQADERLDSAAAAVIARGPGRGEVT
jgi:argininosuccinate lyase